MDSVRLIVLALLTLTGCQTQQTRELDRKVITVDGKQYYVRCGIGTSCHIMEVR